MSYLKIQVEQETIVQKERSDVHMLYMKDQVDQETIVQKERSDVHMSYMKDQVETKKPQFRRKDLM